MAWKFSAAALAALCLMLSCLPAAHAQIISGPAQIIDGDTLSLTGTRIRLFGIDAPEARQTCERDGEAWACGEEASAWLTELVGDRTVECTGRERDRYGRLVAVCRAGRTDLGEAMVLAGLATAYRKYSLDYIEAEEYARRNRIGIWGATFQSPEQWRAGQPSEQSRAAAVAAPADGPAQPRIYRDDQGRCAIKGNHSRRGEWIYHLPGRPYYEQTRPEALFCTEEEAIRAGYRASRAR